VIGVRQWPLWVRYAIAFVSAAIIFVALVIYVHDHSSQAEGLPASPNKAQAAATQQEDRIVVEQQQAPHTVKVTSAAAPATAASSAVYAYMDNQVNHGFISGPIDGRASCSAAGGTKSRLLFDCKVEAGTKVTRLKYPFKAVVSPAAARVTYCQVVTSPDPSIPSPPLSAACR
jgi:hypothetical protein